MGIDKTKKEMVAQDLSDLLQSTQDMNATKATQNYNNFVKTSEKRINGVIYRLNHNYNIGKKLNAINK